MDPEITKGVIEASGTVLAGIIIGASTLWITQVYQREKDKQDKEAQWRTHAIELTKLDAERKLKAFEKNPNLRIRPFILDFLANYRDLSGLANGAANAGALYDKILESRIQKIGKSNTEEEEKA